MSLNGSLEINKNRLWDVVNVLLLAIFAFFVVNIARLYYHYVYHVKGDGFNSDIPAHIRGALNTERSDYSLNGVVIRFLIRLSGTEMSVVVWIVALLVATCVVGGIIAWLFFGKPDRRYYPLLLMLGTVPCFIGAIYIPHFYRHHYMRTLTGTAWHNDTLIEMRLFAMITLLLFYLVMKRIKEESKFFVPWVFFVLCLFLTVGFKTNFYFSFCPLAGIILIIHLIRSLVKKAWKKSLYILLTGLSILAVLPVLFYQRSVLFNGGGSSGESTSSIALSLFSGWQLPFPDVVLKPLLSVLPFLSVLIYSIFKKRVTKEWMFLVGLWCIDLAISSFFTETGARASHGNFVWGRYSSMYILNFVSFMQYCRYLIEMKKGEHQKAGDTIAVSLITVIFLTAIASGILYFYKIAWGGFGYGI